VSRASPAARRPTSDLEAAQVDLAQRPLADLHVDDVAVPFVVVGDEVLEGRADALRLDPARHRGRHPAADQWILRVVLEVAAAERVAMQVERRRE
jgi:hypothetical protein